jgi:hypothetical protein
MKIKLVAVVLLGTGLISFGLIRTASTVQKQQPPYKERLKWYAKEAKSGDRKKVTIPADVVEYLGSAGTITVEEAFFVQRSHRTACCEGELSSQRLHRYVEQIYY